MKDSLNKPLFNLFLFLIYTNSRRKDGLSKLVRNEKPWFILLCSKLTGYPHKEFRTIMYGELEIGGFFKRI